MADGEQLIYLDYNATTPYAPEVIETVTKSMKELWGNASSTHLLGVKTKEAINKAREQVQKMISAEYADEIIFTSGGTESNATVLNILSAGDHLITTLIEHPSITQPISHLQGIDVSYIKPRDGQYKVNPDDIMNAITPQTKLVTVMLANNETGVIQDIAAISQKIHEHNQRHQSNILIHTDAAQAIGKIPVSVSELQVDYLTIVGHKFYGPRNGALYIRRGSPLKPLLYGGGQEGGQRSGTENTAMICGLGTACELVTENLTQYANQMKFSRDVLAFGLSSNISGVVMHGMKQCRLPNTLNFSLPPNSQFMTGSEFLSQFPSIIAGIGAACHSGDTNGSAVLLQCGVPSELATRAIRFSTGRENTMEEMEKVLNMIKLELSSHKGTGDQ